jgi:hypothetical protein
MLISDKVKGKEKTIPEIVYDENEQAVIVYCNPNLWKYINELRKTSLDNMNIVQLMKVYKEVKALF